MLKHRNLLPLVVCLVMAACTSTQPTKSNKRQQANLAPGEYEVFGKVYRVMDDNLGYLEIGIASWYGKKFHGRLTAMGEVYDMYEMTAAHKALPLPTVVKVTNLDNGRSVEVRVNDRGPFHDDRLIDLSYGAAKALGFETKGTAPVVVEAIDEINHPELVIRHEPHESWYLQIGAFSKEVSAVRQMVRVEEVVPVGLPVRILTSETEESILYKVWVGPIESFEEEQSVENLLIDSQLGKPIRVKVD